MRHQLFIAYRTEANQNEEEDQQHEGVIGQGLISRYYCTCRSGARTLGCYAHIASVLWFLGYARHQPRVKYPNAILLNYITDAGHRPHKRNILEMKRIDEIQDVN